MTVRLLTLCPLLCLLWALALLAPAASVAEGPGATQPIGSATETSTSSSASEAPVQTTSTPTAESAPAPPPATVPAQAPTQAPTPPTTATGAPPVITTPQVKGQRPQGRTPGAPAGSGSPSSSSPAGSGAHRGATGGSSATKVRRGRRAPSPSALTPPLPLSLFSSIAGVPQFFIESFRIPPFLLPIYQAAGTAYGVSWQVLAAINEVETDYGRDLGVSSAGAEGWMQFLPSSWAIYGVDANGAGYEDPYNPADAIFAAARYLRAAGAATNLRGAIFAYNHSQAYVESVMLRAKLLGGTPSELLGAITGLTEARFPVHALSHFSDGFPTVSGSASSAPRTIPATTIYSEAGAPVIAVQDGQIVQIGDSPELGHFISLRDAYGNTYTYAQLGSVSALYPVLKPHEGTAVSPPAAASSQPAEPRPTGPASAGTQPGATAPPVENTGISALSLESVGQESTPTSTSTPTSSSSPAGGSPAATVAPAPISSPPSAPTVSSQPAPSPSPPAAPAPAAPTAPAPSAPAASAPSPPAASAPSPPAAPAPAAPTASAPSPPAASAPSAPAAAGPSAATAPSQPPASPTAATPRAFREGSDEVYLHTLHTGVTVIAGTVLGHVGAETGDGASSAEGGAPHMLFQIRPAGVGAPLIDPKPILDGWVQLENTSIFRAKGRNPFVATAPTVGQVLLESKEQLEQQVLENPGIGIDRCWRQDIQTGEVDRRVLATLEFLEVSDLKPTASALKCGASGLPMQDDPSGNSLGYSVDISAINGIPIAGHQGPGSITDTTIRTLLTLQGSMEPQQIASLMSYPGAANTLATPADSEQIHVGFTPPYAVGASVTGAFGTAITPQEWIQLIARLGEIPDPTVLGGPSSASIPDQPAAPAQSGGGANGNS